MTLYDILSGFFIYGFLGWCAEVAFAAVRQHSFVNRGFLNGPICPIYGIGVIMVVAALQPYLSYSLFLYFASAVVVTILELITGILLEYLFHHKWWDYSDMPLNIGGYVCPLFSLIWGAGCVFIVKFLYPLTSKLTLLLPIWLGQILLVILCAALLADICITIKGILNFNKKLALMEELAQELHKISDQIGENIYQNMMDGLVVQDKLKGKVEDIRQNADEIYSKYKDLLENQPWTSRRLLKAFPKMRPRIHVKEFNTLKKFIKRAKDRHKK